MMFYALYLGDVIHCYYLHSIFFGASLCGSLAASEASKRPVTIIALWWTETMASLRSEMIRTLWNLGCSAFLVSNGTQWYKHARLSFSHSAETWIYWETSATSLSLCLLNAVQSHLATHERDFWREATFRKWFAKLFGSFSRSSTALRLGRYQPRRDPPPWQETALPLVEICGLRSLAILDPRRW